MDIKKALLGAASVLALTAAAGQPAEAATTADPSEESASKVTTTEADLLFELLSRTQGSLSADSIEDALPKMFANASLEKIERLPALYRDVISLGVNPETVERLREVLTRLVSTFVAEEALQRSVIEQLGLAQASITLAQNRMLCSTDPSSPNYDPNCPPLGTPGAPGTPGHLGGGPGS
jgi:hypothetical protein